MSENLPGLSFPTEVEQTPALYFNVAERTDLSLAALNSLGLVGDKARATETIGERMQKLHDSLGEVTKAIEPFLSIDLTEKFGLDALITAFDAKQQYDTYVYELLWNKYSLAQLNSRRVGDKPKPATDVTAVGRAMLLGGDSSYGEAGLYRTGKTIDQQRSTTRNEQLINIADYVILNAQRREAGDPLLDRQTFTRFPQMDKKRVDGVLLVPGAYSCDGQLRLSVSYGWAVSGGGVRLSVG